MYNRAKKAAKRVVAIACKKDQKDWYEELENAANEKEVLKVAKQRFESSKDMGTINFIANEQGLLTAEKNIRERWREY